VDALRSQRLEAKRVGNGGIDAPADEEKYIPIARRRPDLIFDGLNLTGWIPILLAGADVEEEILQDSQPARSMRNFGMKLDREQAAFGRGHGRDRACFGAGQHLKTLRNGGNHVAMAHPDLLASFDAAEDGICAGDVKKR
jgi:hypothetical protein